MATCEVCGYEQFPFDSKQAPGKDGRIHWFCSMEHLEEWQKGNTPPLPPPEAVLPAAKPMPIAKRPASEAPELQKAVVEEEVPAAEAVSEPETPKKTPPKRRYTRKAAGKSPRAAKKD